jgi:hypothetical protein
MESIRDYDSCNELLYLSEIMLLVMGYLRPCDTSGATRITQIHKLQGPDQQMVVHLGTLEHICPMDIWTPYPH